MNSDTEFSPKNPGTIHLIYWTMLFDLIFSIDKSSSGSDPLPGNGSGSGSGYGSGTNSNFFLLNFICIRFKNHNDVFCCCNFELIIRVY